MRNIIMLVMIFGLIAACANNDVNTEETPQAAAEAFLLLIDQGNYQETWSEASAWMRKHVDVNQWTEHAGSIRQALGNVDHREFHSIEFHDALEDMPAGNYALVYIDSSLGNDGSASEMVGLMLDDDSSWRVIGYQTH